MSDSIRFLVASDIHAGYGENKAVIGNDSFDGLEEVLEHAVKQDVDFVLLGGDLYHEAVPSRFTEHRVKSLFRQHCLSNRPVDLRLDSEPSEIFSGSQFQIANYEDPNLNVGMPVFSIHGNHDDFAGKGLVALDLLHDGGLVNLFGKFTNLDKMEVVPLLLSKGEHGKTKIALYGIGSQNDDRLARALQTNKIKFKRPPNPEEYFSIFVVHQNRPPRSTTRSTGKYLPMNLIPSFFHLVIWGHEHECRIEPEQFEASDRGEVFVVQPGSTVATSICPDEAVPKKVGVVEIKDTTFKMTPVPLRRTRQVVYEELILAKVDPNPRIHKSNTRGKKEPDERIIEDKIKEMLQEAAATRGPEQPDLPRMRLKVVYSGAWTNIPPVNKNFGYRFKDQVANPADLIMIKRVRNVDGDEEDLGERDFDPANPFVVTEEGGEGFQSLGDLVQKALASGNVENRCKLLDIQSMQKVVDEAIRIDNKVMRKKLLSDAVEHQIGIHAGTVARALGGSDFDNDVRIIEKSADKCLKQLVTANLTRISKECVDDAGIKLELDTQNMDEADDCEVLADSDEFPGFADD
uniref:Double-strand break repair protein n=1 Tax=Panagrellus redivivus TaxID=6233 RepID=A0A7E4VNP4_PANRE